jgi:hypothetical protein
MSKSYKETAVSIPATEAAIITASDMTELELVMPKMEDDADLPEAALFLVACAMRYHADPAFVEAQLRWLEKHKGDRE